MRRIGIDVGGTNTDAALVEDGVVVAAIKTPTTDDVTSGIAIAIAQLPHDDVSAVVVGTTHFTNAVVQRKYLNKVGFLRLCLPTGASLPPLVGWPKDLAESIHGETVMVRGGIEYDGRPFEELDEDGVREAARRFADAGVTSIVVAGSFSPVDSSQEERAAELLQEHLPGARVTLSNRLGRLGLLERENAGALNASLLDLAQTTIAAFSSALTEAGFDENTRLFLSQNDGTMLGLEEAARYPVLTFASGPTNSMRGAALLGNVAEGLVVDVGGTTADFGALVAGYPRQANAAVEIGGVRTLFRLPDLLSIGLGGGSHVTLSPLAVGPTSVGQRLLTDARCFGGSVTTLTDAALAAGRLTIDGTQSTTMPEAGDVMALAAQMIAAGADRMKLAAHHVPLIAVGGGAFAVPDELPGISDIIRPNHGDVANAVGAALAQVSGEVDQVFRNLGRETAIATATEIATDRATNSGADAASIEVIEIEDLPLAYLPGDARRVRVRVVGDLAR
ncbi:MAG: N-methylhydantoinase A/oxoprolinase/acetone carboxylase beta subunit [Candidatus Poriferisodalaceae bacterium]|jgi:N-methylhydantoinase A/oxoprolinase/acetone carboxylase beta subunit